VLARHRFHASADASGIVDLRALVEHVPVLRLRYPSDFDRLAGAHAVVVAIAHDRTPIEIGRR
jgi:hypothetical protein